MVFQLITFFMLVINFKAAEMDLALMLPVIGSAAPVEKEAGSYLVLNIKQNTEHPEGFLSVYGKEYYKGAIDDFIKERARNAGGPPNSPSMMSTGSTRRARR